MRHPVETPSGEQFGEFDFAVTPRAGDLILIDGEWHRVAHLVHRLSASGAVEARVVVLSDLRGRIP